MNVAKLSGLGIACLCLAFSQPVKAEILTLFAFKVSFWGG